MAGTTQRRLAWIAGAVLGLVPVAGEGGTCARELDPVECSTAELRAAEASGDRPAARAALARRAETHLALGLLDLALADVDRALVGLDSGVPPREALELKGLRGVINTRAGDIDKARADLGEALLLAVMEGTRRDEAVTLANIATFLLLERRTEEAAAIYRESAALARSAGADDIAAIAHLNLADLLLELGRPAEAAAALDDAAALMPARLTTAADVSGQIKAGHLRTGIAAALPAEAARQGRLAHAALSDARSTARALGMRRLESYAAGYLGALYETGGRAAEARLLTRDAIDLAARVQAPEALYQWQWQLGRIERANGETEAAIAAHRAAIETLSSVQRSILTGFGTGREIFDTTVRPLILGLADLLLAESERVTGADERQRLLLEARATVELLKAAEVEQYFHDDCLAALQAKRREIDALPEGSAALYPVVLPDRIELILSVGSQLERTVTQVPATELTARVDRFRSGLVDAGRTASVADAALLYDWLVRPVAGRLEAERIDTLVVVPSGLLASIPFAALHDGTGYLVERLAIAVVPGLSLIDPRPFPRGDAEALAGGLSVPVGGFPALPFVANEIERLSALTETTGLRDAELSRDRLSAALDRAPYRILHLATHAEFEADVADSFLLTYDGRLDMEGLERLVRRTRFRDEPIELLTLSACSTAEGDPRAALGLAGVGLKSGARSALASLWVVNDRSTAELTGRFYDALLVGGATKAEALRSAQLALLADPATRHPSFWAAFLIIGNWL